MDVSGVTKNPAATPAASPEQQRYALVQEIGARLGYAVLLATFVIYAMGWLPAGVPLAELPRYWSLSVDEFVRVTGAPLGWGWLARLHQSDFLNYLGVALLGLVTVACYIAVLPRFLRSGDRAFAFIVIAELAVLLLAAVGLGAH
jgi:hypothetical protein